MDQRAPPPWRNSFPEEADIESELQITQALSQYDNMPPAERLAKLDQILLLYTKGDEDAVEGLKLSYMALVSRHACGSTTKSS